MAGSPRDRRAGVSASASDRSWVRVCDGARLRDGGDGVRFEWVGPGRDSPPTRLAAFALRVGGRVHAYLNRCAHVAVELDWVEGKFLDESGRHVICATHGATYEADSGRCSGGPCLGRGGLIALRVEERADGVWVEEAAQAPED
ncbi:MAG: Rieske 2Fe-2S domain-containing protein [Burkholderiales bacterium]|nr:MAG: Rieske 2Fe-2S domain-containing protein [Burkholderiales bacterium]